MYDLQRELQEQRELNRLASNDVFIINSLRRCDVSAPVIFSLVWGQDMTDEKFPPNIRKIVAEIINEEEKKQESLDSSDMKLHSIILDLLQVMYEKEVMDIVVAANTLLQD